MHQRELREQVIGHPWLLGGVTLGMNEVMQELASIYARPPKCESPAHPTSAQSLIDKSFIGYTRFNTSRGREWLNDVFLINKGKSSDVGGQVLQIFLAGLFLPANDTNWRG